jgi:hypothetical protein
MRSFITSSLVGAAAFLASPIGAAPAPTIEERDVDTKYPYTGPEVPIGDWVDPTINGNGKGFARLVEAPAVTPKSKHPTNNINVISVSYVPNGINIHFQTPFGLTEPPTIKWGYSNWLLPWTAKGTTHR